MEIAAKGHMPLRSTQLLQVGCSVLPSTMAGTSRVKNTSRKHRTVVTMTDLFLTYLQQKPNLGVDMGKYAAAVAVVQ